MEVKIRICAFLVAYQSFSWNYRANVSDMDNKTVSSVKTEQQKKENNPITLVLLYYN